MYFRTTQPEKNGLCPGIEPGKSESNATDLPPGHVDGRGHTQEEWIFTLLKLLPLSFLNHVEVNIIRHFG